MRDKWSKIMSSVAVPVLANSMLWPFCSVPPRICTIPITPRNESNHESKSTALRSSPSIY